MTQFLFLTNTEDRVKYEDCIEKKKDIGHHANLKDSFFCFLFLILFLMMKYKNQKKREQILKI